MPTSEIAYFSQKRDKIHSALFLICRLRPSGWTGVLDVISSSSKLVIENVVLFHGHLWHVFAASFLLDPCRWAPCDYRETWSTRDSSWCTRPGGNSSLVLAETCCWEFEIGPIHIPTLQEKGTHSYTNRPIWGQIVTKFWPITRFFLFFKFS